VCPPPLEAPPWVESDPARRARYNGDMTDYEQIPEFWRWVARFAIAAQVVIIVLLWLWVPKNRLLIASFRDTGE
jgi:hypothetical protein